MISLTRFSEEDLKLIEELIDSKIESIYRMNDKYGNRPFSTMRNPDPYIVLKTKILNMKKDY
jgi:hypothetical protein